MALDNAVVGYAVLVEPPSSIDVAERYTSVNGTTTSVEVTYSSDRPLVQVRTAFESKQVLDLPLIGLAHFLLDASAEVPPEQSADFVQGLLPTLARVNCYHSPLTVDGRSHPGLLLVFAGNSLHYATIGGTTISLITAAPQRGIHPLRTVSGASETHPYVPVHDDRSNL